MRRMVLQEPEENCAQNDADGLANDPTTTRKRGFS
jgi:hypothetical protein